MYQLTTMHVFQNMYNAIIHVSSSDGVLQGRVCHSVSIITIVVSLEEKVTENCFPQ